jgi:hypothetical protein
MGEGTQAKGSGQGKSNQHWQAKYEAKRATPEGKAICFAYNNNGERCVGACNREHVCQVCFGKHPGHVHHKFTAAGSGGSGNHSS